MIGRPQTYSTRFLVKWADFVGLHSSLVLFLSFLATAGVLIYTVNHFRIDTEMTDMISSKLPYRKLEKEFEAAFPQLRIPFWLSLTPKPLRSPGFRQRDGLNT